MVDNKGASQIQRDDVIDDVKRVSLAIAGINPAHISCSSYAQTSDTLHDSHGFCCLGVGCDISNIGKWHAEEYHFIDTDGYETYVSGDWNSDDRHTFYQLYGITEDQEADLAHANDGGMVFWDIAQMIRALPLPDEGKS